MYMYMYTYLMWERIKNNVTKSHSFPSCIVSELSLGTVEGVYLAWLKATSFLSYTYILQDQYLKYLVYTGENFWEHFLLWSYVHVPSLYLLLLALIATSGKRGTWATSWVPPPTSGWLQHMRYTTSWGDVTPLWTLYLRFSVVHSQLDGPLYSIVQSLFIHTLAQWEEHKLSILRRLLVLAHARSVSSSLIKQ